MSKNKNGIVLHEARGKYSWTRIPKWIVPSKETTFQITTEGLVYSSSGNPGDPLDWNVIAEPGSSNGNKFWGIDWKGTVKFNTPISLIVTGRDGVNTIKEFPDMPTDFYFKLVNAIRVAKYFTKDPKEDTYWRRDALRIWAEKYKNEKDVLDKETYIDEVCRRKIDMIFENEPSNRDRALELFEDGAFETTTFLKPLREIGHTIREKIKGFEAVQTEEKEQANKSADYRKGQQDNRTPEEIEAQKEIEERKARGITRKRSTYKGPDRD